MTLFNGKGTGFVPYFDVDSDFINFMMFPLEIRDLKKTDRPRADVHIEMRGRI